MPEMRKDPLRDGWVIIATEQGLKPHNFPINKGSYYAGKNHQPCPFCEGNEDQTTPEITAFRRPGTRANQPGWSIRTVTNKFSPFKLEGDFQLEQDGLYTSHNGLGQHEVVIETTEHGLEFHKFSVQQIEQVYHMLRNRYQELRNDRRVKFIQIYKNRGLFAGASQEHSHSQVLALPMLPVLHRGIGEYNFRVGRCLICDLLEREIRGKNRVIWESSSYILFCPYASRYSYETWIVPKKHQEHFGDLNDEEILELAGIMKMFLPAMIESLEDPSYNIVFNSSPVNLPGVNGYHWFIEINPRLMIQNGLEASCGYYINPVSPEYAAEVLRISLGSKQQL